MSIVSDLTTAVFKPSRQIGPYSQPITGVTPLIPFSAQVTIEEVHIDELDITQHPVEQGASITDHAYKKPAKLLMRLGWSNSGVQAALQSVVGLAEVFTGDQSGDFNYMTTMYNKLLQLQESRLPFDVITGKRKYRNMLIRSLTVPSEDKTEHCLLVTMLLEQIIIVTTQTVQSTPASVQKNPQSTAPLANLGNQSLLLKNYTYSPGQINTINPFGVPQ